MNLLHLCNHFLILQGTQNISNKQFESVGQKFQPFQITLKNFKIARVRLVCLTSLVKQIQEGGQCHPVCDNQCSMCGKELPLALGCNVAKSGPGGTQVQHVDAEHGMTLVTIWDRVAESNHKQGAHHVHNISMQWLIPMHGVRSVRQANQVASAA